MLNKYLLSLLLLTTFPVLAKPQLTIYTYDSFAASWGPGPKVKAAFEANCDCTVKFVALEDGVSLLNRLRLEGQKSSADIVLGLDNNLLQAARKTGLFAESRVDTRQLTLPGGWQDSTFIPYDYGYFAFIYNKNRLTDPPRSLQELINSDRNWTIIYQDPRTSTVGLGLLLWMQKLYGDQAGEQWKKLAKKTITVPKGWSEAYGLFLKGESDMVLSYTTSPAYHQIEEGDNSYAAANFSEGHYLQIEIAGKLKNSKHPELAEQFMQFMISPAFQDHIAHGNWMYPVLENALPAEFKQIAIPKVALQFSAKDVAQKRSDWTRAWQNAVSH
ncbi:thiamine ABC transporter substrate binding subunit [Serratia microhaemolytica]|uniref:thiamine ABC transporter substrate binding subunit n=1 Tax=Serratia microhaemolytica TaxID=2675110 RepID=UPI000FDE31D5